MPFFVPEEQLFFCSSCSSLNYYDFCPVFDNFDNGAAHRLYHQKYGLYIRLRRAGFSQDFSNAVQMRPYIIFVLQKHNILKNLHACISQILKGTYFFTFNCKCNSIGCLLFRTFFDRNFWTRPGGHSPVRKKIWRSTCPTFSRAVCEFYQRARTR